MLGFDVVKSGISDAVEFCADSLAKSVDFVLRVLPMLLFAVCACVVRALPVAAVLFGLALALGGPSVALAQTEPPTISDVYDSFDFASMAMQLVTVLATGLAIVVTVALGVFVIVALFGMLRRWMSTWGGVRR